MTVIRKIRIYHTILATLSILAYITGDAGIIHPWLGYGVTAVIVFRLLWALIGNHHAGLMRFYPSFKGLKCTNLATHPAISKLLMLSIAICLITVTSTGIALDKGRSIGLASVESAGTVLAADNGAEEKHHHRENKGPYRKVLKEGHELFANLLLLMVAMHVSYLFTFKRPLAKFMLFLNKSDK